MSSMHLSAKSRIRQAALVVLAALGVLQPQPASAHAELVGTEPADHASLDEQPSEVVLTFTEEVTALPGAIRVFDAAGERVDEGSVIGAEGSTELSTPLVSGLGNGAYVVSWSVVSLDDHPIRGAFVFQVGDAPAAHDDLIASVLSGADASGARTTGVAVRWMTYAGSLVAVGATAMLFSLRATAARLAVRKLVLIAAVVGVVGSVLSVPVQAAEVSGLGWSVVSAPDLLSEVLGGGVGRAAMVRIAGLAALMVAVWALGRSRSLPVALAGPAAAVVLVSDLLTGHTITTDPTWLVMSADIVHLLAAALWAGGMAALLVAFRSFRAEGEAAGAAEVVGAFSRLATWSIVALVAGGVVLGWLEVRTLDALFTTAYGRTLLVKVGLGLVVIAMGAYNNRVLVPAIQRSAAPAPAPVAVGVGTASSGLSEPPPDGQAAAWTRLRRTMSWELVGLGLVVAVTSLLVNLQPAAEAAGVTGAFSTYVPLGSDGSQVNLVVDPNRAGTNQVHAYLIDPSGRPADLGEGVGFVFSLPDREVGPIEREPVHAGTGHYLHVGPELAIPGRWEIEVVVSSEFEDTSATVEVTVNP
jgi:copper transport protein